MKARWRIEADEWTADGPRITDPELLKEIEKVLEEEGPIIVEHRLYRGASRPEWAMFNELEDFEAYLNEHCSAGDDIWVWSHWRVCKDENVLVHGKCPDDDGLTPRKGAY